MARMKKVTASWTEKEGKRIKQEAARRGISVSRYLREAFQRAVKNYGIKGI